MSDFTATPDQWAYQEHWAAEDGDAACILELRCRVEALEVDADEDSTSTHFCLNSIIKRLEALEANAKPELDWISRKQLDQVAELLRPNKPDTSLVERVVLAISRDSEVARWSEARAALREVAAWLGEHGHPAAADVLEVVEAKR
jgi:hypothetical protein